MDIREIDPHDERLVRRFWEIGQAAEDAYRVVDMFWPWESAWAMLTSTSATSKAVLLGAFDAAAMCGTAMVDLPLRDNTHLANAEVYVDPPRQRRGVGRALLGAVEDVARRHGRRTLVVDASAPVGADSAGLAFGRAMGFTEAIEEGTKTVDLPATEHLWDDLADEAAPHHRDYSIVTWVGPVPPEYVAGYCTLEAAFVDEAPMGELEVEAEVWDEQRLRDRERRTYAAGRRDIATIALDRRGEVVGSSLVFVNEHKLALGFQSGTLVMPGHRGHRLGMAMKVDNQRAVRKHFPECHTILTGNATVNAAMNAINDRLGFRVVERGVELQKAL
ncbi:MAG TPA: GNAT family N-acetyltransferase [Nocardioidaceae bacterium]|nr:GNAT family N-acetyltransferase [Nocardioidaceae bacterium]